MISSQPKPEIRLQGIGVSPGIAVGPAERVGKALEEPEHLIIERAEVETERQRLNEAIIATREQILALQEKISTAEGENDSAIFDAHLLILEDSSILNEVLRIVETQRKSADWAYYSVSKRYIDSLRKIADPYLRERAVDIEDVAKRLLRNLRRAVGDDGDDGMRPSQPGTSILLAHDLTPSDTVGLDRTRIRGFATELGSPTSHTAIMARSLSIPAVVALHDMPEDFPAGDIVLVDGYHGLIILNPSPATIAEYEAVIERERTVLTDLEPLRHQDTRTADGRKITLSANIEFVEELDGILSLGAEGVGLYRTEFFYLSRPELRDEENQMKNYRKVAEATHPHGVIVRTLDIGGDKLLPELFEDPEPNPFLGWRGIRLSLDQPEEFRLQLRAILRASAFGKIRLMFPFLSTLEELRGAKAQLESAKDELRSEGVDFDEGIEVGAMIEIPSAVLIADHLAPEVDFFSIGSNDLIQYTTAVDRVNDRVAHLYQPAHPAVIAMIRETVEAAHRHGIWCGICGEVAGDLTLAPVWVGLGVDELSVGASQLLRMRRALSRLDSAACRTMTDGLRAYGSSSQVKEASLEIARLAYPELLL
ncbi:MAG: phosphoenolpyruvate--protein phosphotransferase [Verrucomicrobiia bacterium Tous-C2TDCM]|nr:MAG: phosphoenolpyruvate--protein phosphotransferase [Verrucomicrobiae bacterium Tous-C2TDCM]